MALNTRYSAAARNAACNAAVDLLDAGSGAATLKFYTTAQPASPDVAITDQTLLATLTLTDPAFGDAVAGVATAGAITSDVSIDASGTPTWARAADSNGNAIIDFSVGVSGCDINFAAGVTWLAGGTAAMTSFTHTVHVGP